MDGIVTANDIYDTLIYGYKIQELTGAIKFQLGDVKVSVKRRDVIGGILQEWLELWLKKLGIDYMPNPQVNMPPDIYLDPTDITRGWLEIKAFNRNDTPRFSIAYFRTFPEELIKRPWHLDTDYLIFGYVIDERTGNVKIKDLWLKKIWQITKPMTNWPLTVQFKNDVLHEIRPCRWYSSNRNLQVFECLEDFLSAFEKAMYQNPETRYEAVNWQNKFKLSYRKHYGRDIKIPKWEKIMSKYGWGD